MNKKIILCIVACLLVLSASTQAQGLSGLFKSLTGNSSTTTTENSAVDSGTDLVTSILGTLAGSAATTTNDGKAASNDGIVSGILSSVLNSFSSVSQKSLIGTWNYKGSAFVFESENVLATLGSDAIAQQVESKVDKYLSKVNIKEGACSITFMEDNTCTFTAGKKTLNGTYTYDPSSKELVLSYAGLLSTTAYVVYNSNTINIVYQSNGLLKILKSLSSKKSGSTLALLGALLTQYDGLRIGLAFEK